MKYLLTVNFFLIFLLLSCEKRSEDWTSLGPDFLIKYIEGSGWTGQQFSTTIVYPDSLIINEREYIPSPKERTSKYLIVQNEMDSLFQDLQKLKYINLKDYYGFGPNKPTDLPTLYFKYQNCGQIDSALIYSPDENEVPMELLTLLGRINRIIITHDTLINQN
jgi:hypothetical protein